MLFNVRSWWGTPLQSTIEVLQFRFDRLYTANVIDQQFNRCTYTDTLTLTHAHTPRAATKENEKGIEWRGEGKGLERFEFVNGRDSKRIKTFYFALTWSPGSIHFPFGFDVNNGNAKQCTGITEVVALKSIPINIVIGLHYHHSCCSMHMFGITKCAI